MSEMARLRWLCRRGMKELDLLLVNYLEHRYADASSVDQKAFETILQMPDPELNDLILERSQIDDQDIMRVIRLLRDDFSD